MPVGEVNIARKQRWARRGKEIDIPEGRDAPEGGNIPEGKDVLESRGRRVPGGMCCCLRVVV